MIDDQQIVTTLPGVPVDPEAVAADARAALIPGAWMMATQVHQRVGRWSVISVRHALRGLADAGEIETRLSDFNGFSTREYRPK